MIKGKCFVDVELNGCVFCDTSNDRRLADPIVCIAVRKMALLNTLHMNSKCDGWKFS